MSSIVDCACAIVVMHFAMPEIERRILFERRRQDTAGGAKRRKEAQKNIEVYPNFPLGNAGHASK